MVSGESEGESGRSVLHRARSAAGSLLRRADQTLRPRAWSGIGYWERRASRMGADAVVNLDRESRAIEEITEVQKATLLPMLEAELQGDEETILDLGCGPGRFTLGLASTIDGRAIGVDPVARLLELAPADPAVEYHLMSEGRIPLDDGEADVVWSCLVVGALTDADVLRQTVAEVDRVLAPGGLLFLAESTTEREDLPYWSFRGLDGYRELFAFVDLAERGEYMDLGDRITVMAGRRLS